MKPNIILINCDDLGYGDLGCYGSPVNHTPYIDRLAAEGLRLTDFYAASPVCSPSRGAMLTGCYPPRIGFGSFDGDWVLFPGQGLGLGEQEETLADVLRRAGYATQIIGKWHCGDQTEFLPTRHGFDSWYGLPYSNDMGVQVSNGNPGARRAGFPPLPLMADEAVIQQQPDLAGLTERYTEHAVRFMRENREKPFFLYLAHMHVHLPIYVQEHFLQRSQNGKFGAAVETVDWSTGVLMHELEQLGIAENTLVIFTSDNGSRGRADEGSSNLPLRGHKGTTWEGGQRVPCIVRWPGTIAPRADGGLLSSLDFFATLTALAGGAAASGNATDSLDARAFLLDGAPSPRDTFAYYLSNELQAVRHGNYKLHIRKDGADVCLLYDLRADIAETTDISAAHPETVRELQAMAAAFRARLGDSAAGVTGAETRPIGMVDNPQMLTALGAEHPYIIAMYDCADCG